MDILGVSGLVATGLGAIGALGAWRAAHGSNRAASSLTNIERDRWHAELSPVFDVRCERKAKSDAVDLWLTLVGPVGLVGLDSVSLSIRDDRSDRAPVTAASPSAEEIAGTIWGPLRFRPGVDKADQLGRSVPGIAMAKLAPRRLALEPSLVPLWADGQHWRRQYENDPLRLQLICHKDGFKRWVVPTDVPIEVPSLD